MDHLVKYLEGHLRTRTNQNSVSTRTVNTEHGQQMKPLSVETQTKKHISSKRYAIIRSAKAHRGQMSIEASCSNSNSFIPIHSFQLPWVSNLPNLSWLAQLDNLQLILSHLRWSEGGGRRRKGNGMRCHSVVACMNGVVAKPLEQGWRGFIR